MFIVLLILSVALAWIAPEVGSPNAWFSPSEIAGWGVTLIFFFYGLELSPKKLKTGLRNFRLHEVVQLSTFVLFPILILLAMWIAPDWRANYYLWLGVYFVAALPSTVSSSVVMVSLARGNLPAAIFNASISSLIGVAMTPVLMSIFVTTEMGGSSLGVVIFKLIVQVILPVGTGMFLNRYWGKWAERHGRLLTRFDQGVILAIVYTAFCEGFQSGIFTTVTPKELVILTVGMTALFFVVYYSIHLISKLLKFDREDRITALFCGSKKSLVHGTVMSRVIVSDTSLVGIILLPIMIYHAMQLFIVSFIARRMGQEYDKNHTINIPSKQEAEK